MRWKIMAGWGFFLSCLAAGPVLAQPEAEKAAALLRDSNCRSCHGETGDSPSATVPRLNGQDARYLRSRLESFRYPIREAPRMIHDMGHVSPQLNSRVIVELAKFYAAQNPPAQAGRGSKAGAAIYRTGAKGIPACRTCHGDRGEGLGAAPRLAGQHEDYLRMQLDGFAMAARIADPMNHHVWVMTPQQSKAVAAYLGN